MFFVKLILELFPFIWECFFGNKIPKDTPKESETKEKNSGSVSILKKILGTVQHNRKVALCLIILLSFSLFLNYYFGNRIIALAREDGVRKNDDNRPTLSQPIDRTAYYNNLVLHLEYTYQASK